MKIYTWRDPAALSRTVVLWLYLNMAAQVLAAFAATIHLADSSGLDPAAPADTPLVSDIPVAALWLVYLMVVVVSGFLILKWIYRISRNAHAAAQGLRISPPWAVGWYFVPFAAFWKPFQAMREAWQVGVDRSGWQAVPVPGLLRWWWGLFLLTTYLGWASARLTLGGGTMASARVSDLFDLLSLPLSLALDVVFIRVVRAIAAGQAIEPGERAAAAEAKEYA
jgi:hypothetical protein